MTKQELDTVLRYITDIGNTLEKACVQHDLIDSGFTELRRRIIKEFRTEPDSH
jgi:hypothetical protein